VKAEDANGREGVAEQTADIITQEVQERRWWDQSSRIHSMNTKSPNSFL
jgi:hypothetical protein